MKIGLFLKMKLFIYIFNKEVKLKIMDRGKIITAWNAFGLEGKSKIFELLDYLKDNNIVNELVLNSNDNINSIIIDLNQFDKYDEYEWKTYSKLVKFIVDKNEIRVEQYPQNSKIPSLNEKQMEFGKDIIEQMKEQASELWDGYFEDNILKTKRDNDCIISTLLENFNMNFIDLVIEK